MLLLFDFLHFLILPTLSVPLKLLFILSPKLFFFNGLSAV